MARHLTRSNLSFCDIVILHFTQFGKIIAVKSVFVKNSNKAITVDISQSGLTDWVTPLDTWTWVVHRTTLDWQVVPVSDLGFVPEHFVLVNQLAPEILVRVDGLPVGVVDDGVDLLRVGKLYRGFSLVDNLKLDCWRFLW